MKTRVIGICCKMTKLPLRELSHKWCTMWFLILKIVAMHVRCYLYTWQNTHDSQTKHEPLCARCYVHGSRDSLLSCKLRSLLVFIELEWGLLRRANSWILIFGLFFANSEFHIPTLYWFSNILLGENTYSEKHFLDFC